MVRVTFLQEVELSVALLIGLDPEKRTISWERPDPEKYLNLRSILK